MRSMLAVAALALSCTAAPSTKHPAPTVDKPVLTGAVSRETMLAIPGWAERGAALDEAIDDEAARKLAAVPSAEVTIILGTWCSDSKRELPRLYRALDRATAGGIVLPWKLETIGVDRDRRAPGLDVAALGVTHVPTFIVRRGGQELGRIVESAPNGVERDLLALLDGSRTGVISGRQDLAPAR